MRYCLSCSSEFKNGWRCPSCGFEPQNISGFTSFAPQLAEGTSAFPDFYRRLSGLESRSFWFRSRNALIKWGVETYFPKARTYLELGCGTGFVLKAVEDAFPQMSICGSELHIAGLEIAATRVQRSALYQIDGRNLPFRAEFDVVGAFDVIEHIEQDIDVLTQIHKALRVGGGLLITVPQHRFLWGPDDEHAGHHRRYTRIELCEKLSAAGFTIVRATSFVSLLFPLMFVSRWSRKMWKIEYDPTSELRIGKLANFFLERIMSLEGQMIRRGCDFRVGGSLFVVAVKQA